MPPQASSAITTPRRGDRALSPGVPSTPKTPPPNLPAAIPASALPAPPQIKSANGLVVELIKYRLYLASYSSPPTSSTVIPFPRKADRQSSAKDSKLSPIRRNSPSKLPRGKISSASTPSKTRGPIFFTCDDRLFYNKFHMDFGPFNIGHLYRFAVCLHDYMSARENKNRQIVFWSRSDPKSRANAACLVTAYLVLCQDWAPHAALAPIAQLDPPLMPFRDAGYSQADYMISVQDVLYGIFRAKENRLLSLKYFDVDAYERFERVDQGDFNWVSPDFIAFASPVFPPPPPPKKLPNGQLGPKLQYTNEFFARHKPEGGKFPTNLEELASTKLTESFRNVLEYFYTEDVGLVVRLNSHLYPAEYFNKMGITHLDMIFDDGTCPTDSMIRKFINVCNKTIANRKKIAVHCKAGLGRTGCLIGAYLIYRYGFSANECIAYMRFMRPGMVVGPQQHWMHIKHDTIRQWAFEDAYAEERRDLLSQIQVLQDQQGAVATRQSSKHRSRNLTPNDSTPPPRRSILGEISSMANDISPDHLPAPTPGQPRKNSAKFFSPNRYSTSQDHKQYVDGIRVDTDDENTSCMEAEELSEEELHLRITAKRLSSRSPRAGGVEKRRSVSYTYSSTVSATPSRAAAAAAAPASPTNASTTPLGSPITIRKISGDKTPPHMVAKSGNGISSSKVRAVRRIGAMNHTRDGRVRKVSGRVVSQGTSSRTAE
ncbi:cell division control protein 14 [Orbilia brochopaga]|uniref:Cell division control protein 14 n=1 Tax=Orbilia brochopaga TaxID=3140254 RepID=A0AAV9U4A3_9PEZI